MMFWGGQREASAETPVPVSFAVHKSHMVCPAIGYARYSEQPVTKGLRFYRNFYSLPLVTRRFLFLSEGP